jgi:hypothetical protein
MAMNLAQVASYSAFKIRQEHFYVALTVASLLPTILKTKQETAHDMNYQWFVNSHVKLSVLTKGF